MQAEETYGLVHAAFTDALGPGVDDDTNFFDAGGDSLASETLIVDLSRRLGLDLPGWLLLDHPTVPSLTEAILDLKGSGERRC